MLMKPEGGLEAVLTLVLRGDRVASTVIGVSKSPTVSCSSSSVQATFSQTHQFGRTTVRVAAVLRLFVYRFVRLAVEGVVTRLVDRRLGLIGSRLLVSCVA